MSERVRILFTIPNFITAGSGQVMVNIIKRLDRKKFAPAVCISRKGGRLETEIEKLGIPLIEAPFTVSARPYLSLPFRAWEAARVFRPYGFELWHSFHYADDYTEPIIAHISGAKKWVYTKKAMGWGSRGWLLRSYLASRIVADNPEMLGLMFDRIGLRKKVRMIPHGIPTDQYPERKPIQHRLRAKLNIPVHQFVIGCVAHLVPVKGHPTLLRAIAKVPSAQLLIAGRPMDQEYADQLSCMVEELGIKDKVRFLGGVEDVSSLLGELDAVALPTRPPGEGCPVALLEAMSCGKACIATDLPGARDIIEDGKNGLLVPPEDATSLAEAISRLSSSPELRASLGVAARKRIEERFSIEREVADHEDLYAGIFPRVRSSNTGGLRTELSGQFQSM